MNRRFFLALGGKALAAIGLGAFVPAAADTRNQLKGIDPPMSATEVRERYKDFITWEYWDGSSWTEVDRDLIPGD